MTNKIDKRFEVYITPFTPVSLKGEYAYAVSVNGVKIDEFLSREAAEKKVERLNGFFARHPDEENWSRMVLLWI